jgi:predicted ATP-grasp superfamily ATP-dependent carboligase
MKKLLFLSLLIFVSSSYPRSGLQQFAQAVSSQLNAYSQWHEKTLQDTTQAEKEFVTSLREFASKKAQAVRSAAHSTIQAISSNVIKFAEWREKTLQEAKQAEQARLHAIRDVLYNKYEALNKALERKKDRTFAPQISG